MVVRAQPRRASPPLDRAVAASRAFWVSPTGAAVDPGPTIHLLPNYDELLVAFRDRADGLHPALPAGARVAEEILNHVIVRDGLVVGRWQRPTVASGPLVRLEPRVALDADDRRRLQGAVDRYGAFIGRELEVTVLSSATPSGRFGLVDSPGRDSSVGRARD